LRDGSRILAPLGLVFDVCVSVIAPILPGLAILVFLLSKACWLAGLGVYTLSRGRHWAWGALGLFGCFGWGALWLLLGKRCLNCKAETSTETCAFCGAPAPS
jgi:hypothetical protein